MRATKCGLWLGLTLALAADACALTGYDFGDYQRAGNAAGNQAAGAGGEPINFGPFSVGLSAAGGAAGETAEAGKTPGQAAGAGGAASCEPQTCFALGLECGLGPQQAEDGCGAGQVLDCGGCFWWFQECRQNTCVIPQ